MDIGMFSQLTIMFGFMGIQVIQHNMQFCFRIIVYNAIHKIQKFPTASVRVTLIFVAKPSQSLSIR